MKWEITSHTDGPFYLFPFVFLFNTWKKDSLYDKTIDNSAISAIYDYTETLQTIWI